MKFLKENTTMHQPDTNQSRRFTLGQYVAAVSVLLLSFTAISYAAGLLALKPFTPGTAISSTDVNANFQSLSDQLNAMTASMVAVSTSLATVNATVKSNEVPAGTLIAYSGTTIPAGYLRCPTNPTSASDSAYPALSAAVGSTWGAKGASTFILPWFPEGYTLLQTSTNVGVLSVGQVIAHTHAVDVYNDSSANGQASGSRQPTSGLAGSPPTQSTGGIANYAAGAKVMILVKM